MDTNKAIKHDEQTRLAVRAADEILKGREDVRNIADAAIAELHNIRAAVIAEREKQAWQEFALSVDIDKAAPSATLSNVAKVLATLAIAAITLGLVFTVEASANAVERKTERVEISAIVVDCQSEDSPYWNWRECGNKTRGVATYVTTKGEVTTRVIVLRHAAGKPSNDIFSLAMTSYFIPTDGTAPVLLDDDISPVSNRGSIKATRRAAKKMAKRIIRKVV